MATDIQWRQYLIFICVCLNIYYESIVLPSICLSSSNANHLKCGYGKGAHLKCSYGKGAHLKCGYGKGAHLKCGYGKGAHLKCGYGFEPWLGQTKDYKIGICCFSLSTQH